MQQLSNISKAIINVMKEVEGIDKSMTVRTGASAYKGVPDLEVKKIIGRAMAKHGLCIVPIGVKPIHQIDRWEENSNYGIKQKQSVFTEVVTRYLLIHDSGESIELEGYGHGVDSQDKGAGKATTYALKYTLLYTFLVPTGKIDDSDTNHSDDSEIPKKTTPQQPPPPHNTNNSSEKKWLNEGSEQWTKAIQFLINGGTINEIKKGYRLSKDNEQKLIDLTMSGS